MKPLPPPDAHHLQAAEGWLELGDPLSANDELEKTAAKLRAHPDVLTVRWQTYAHAKKWEACGRLVSCLPNPESARGVLPGC